MSGFIYQRGDQQRKDLSETIQELLGKYGTSRCGVRTIARRLILLGYDNDASEARFAFLLSELQHRASGDGKRRASDMYRVRNAFEAERRRQRSWSGPPTAPRR